MSQTRPFKVGDTVRVTGHSPWAAFSDPDLLPVDTVWKVGAGRQINGWATDQEYACHRLDLVEEPPAAAELVKDIGLEFLKGSLPRVAAAILGSEEFERGYQAALEDLAAAYGKRIQHVNHMELVDVE